MVNEVLKPIEKKKLITKQVKDFSNLLKLIDDYELKIKEKLSLKNILKIGI